MDATTPPLRAFRHSRNPKLSLKVLAERVGVTEGQLSRVERGARPSFDLALRLSEETGLPMETFAPRNVAA